MKQPAMIRCGLAALVLLCAACSGGNDKSGERPTPEVGFVIVHPTSVPLTTELAGRTAAFAVSEVRPQVSGVIRARLFTEGSIVRRPDPLPDRSLALSGERQPGAANLASAQANREAARTRAAATRRSPGCRR
jgi:membrane fusion protein (multidrug efflux system)